jgi:hypothetical protein
MLDSMLAGMARAWFSAQQRTAWAKSAKDAN